MAKRPDQPGFYWALWIEASDDTPGGEELTPALDYAVVEVVENCINPADPEYLMVEVGGVEQWQQLDGFLWGPEVERPAYLGGES